MKKFEERKTRRKYYAQELPWPENLITAIGLKNVYGEECFYGLNKDQMHGLRIALESLYEREQDVLRCRYEEYKTLEETGMQLNLSKERVDHITKKVIAKLREPSRLAYFRDGYNSTLGKIAQKKKQAAEIRASLEKNETVIRMADIDISDCGFSTRTYNCLARNHHDTLADVAMTAALEPKKFLRMRNLGRKSFIEIIETLEKYGLDCRDARQILVLT